MAECMTIRSIEAKSGDLAEIHTDIIGCECSLFQMHTKNHVNLIITIPVTNSGRDRKIITSDILKYFDRKDKIIVETMNSTYLFVK